MSMRWKPAAALAAAAVLAGCSGSVGDQRAVSGSGAGDPRAVAGTFVRVGGPAPGSPFPLPGSITARAANGKTFTATAGSSGRFTLSLPPGRYKVTGRSPLIGGGQVTCPATAELRVSSGATARRVTVICSIS